MYLAMNVKCITCVNTNLILLLQPANTITSTLMHYCQTAATVEYIQGGPKRTVFPHDAMLRGICYGPVSVRSQTTPHDSPGTPVFWCQRSPRNLTGVTPYRGAKCSMGDFRQITSYISKTVQDRHMVSIKLVVVRCVTCIKFPNVD